MARSRWLHASFKGQTFSPDFIGSILVLGVILTVFLSSWNTVLGHFTGFDRGNQERSQAIHTTSFLVSTPGHPGDWEKDNVDVEIPGFAESDHVLEQDKLEEFRELSYENQTELLQAEDFYMEVATANFNSSERIGRAPVAYIPEQGRDFTELEVIHVMNDSDVTWDLYWPSGENESSLDSLAARNVYNHTTQGDDMFDDMLVNASENEYGTIIAESANLEDDALDQSSKLESFVENGGTYVHTGQQTELIEDVFELNEVSVGSGNGTIWKVEPLLNSSYSDRNFVEFENDPGSFSDADTVFVNDTQDPHGCLACRWSIGSGELYFIPDTVQEDSQALAFFRNGDEAFHTSWVFGKFFLDADLRVPITRNVLLNRSSGLKTAELNYIVWEE